MTSGLGVGVATFSLVSTLSMSLAAGTEIPVVLPLAVFVISACATLLCYLVLGWFDRQPFLVRYTLIMVFVVCVAFAMLSTIRFFNAHCMVVQN